MIKNIIIACRSLTKRGHNNGIKVLSLSAGLAMGLVLIAKVCFEQSYDTFYPDADRIYRVNEKIVMDGELVEYPQVSGGVAVGMREEVPGVEMATRGTWLYEGNLQAEDKKKYEATVIAADECFFDVLPRKMLQGDAKEVLQRPGYALVSRSLAEKIGGGDVVGKKLEAESMRGLELTIGGVFEDVPENSNWRYDAIVSIKVMIRKDFDGTMNWVGNDRYRAFVKLRRGVEPESLNAAMRTMQLNHIDFEEMKKAGMDFEYTLTNLTEIHAKAPETKRMAWLLGLLAFAVMFTAVMNYVMIAISSLVGRTKEVAVHKCYGASAADIHRMILSEALVHLVVSLALAAFLILLFRGTVEELVGASLGALFTSRSVLILLGVCVSFFLVAGLLPGDLFARIPVAAAFRNFSESRRKWKLALLFLQFVAVGFLVSLLTVIARQYHYMVNDDPGYNYDNLAYCDLSGTDSTARAKALDEAMALPGVEAVSTFTRPPFDGASGNNVSLPDDDRQLFNIADLYSVGNGYIAAMEIPIVAGRSFTEDVPSSHEVMVSRKFVDKMAKYVDWPDGPIGKEVFITEHGGGRQPFTICGVYDDIRLGVISAEDYRPSVMFYSARPAPYLLIKYKKLTAEGLSRSRQAIQDLLPDKEIVVAEWRSQMASLYRDSRLFRNSVMIGCGITLVISLIGLIGYTRDEINRRRKEIAIRKINGATVREVLRLFEADILRMALPALVIGCIAAALVATRWQASFSEKVPLAWPMFAACGALTLALIVFVVASNVRSAANGNPVCSLRSE